MFSTKRDVFAAFSIILPCLMPFSHSAPLGCDELSRPLDQVDPHHLMGRWALAAGGFSNPADLDYFRTRDSASVTFSEAASSGLLYTTTISIGGRCLSHSFNISLEGSTLNFAAQDRINLTLTFLYTSCQDCLVLRYDESKQLKRLILFSKGREVEPKDMEEFQASAACAKIPAPAVLDPTKELCDPAGQTEENK